MSPVTAPTYVLGLSLSHNGAACLLKDGEIVVAIEVERLTRKKRDGWGNIGPAIEYCLDAAGIVEADLALKVYATTEWLCPHEQFGVEINHHLAHAASAFYDSPFQEAAVLVVDGSGNPRYWAEPGLPASAACERETESLFLGSPQGLVLLDKRTASTYQDVDAGMGGAFELVSQLLFHDRLEGGKVMGLAAYADRPPDLPAVFDADADEVSFSPDWCLGLRKRPVERNAWSSAEAKRLAHHVQRALEDYLPRRLGHAQRRTGARRLCYAGGVALNCVANGKALPGPFDEVFIQPASHDAGLALGCAYYGHVELLGRKRAPARRASMLLGRSYREADILEALGRRPQLAFRRCDDPAVEAAVLLAENRIVGWFQGGSEFGPRALGNRSILYHPGAKGAKDRLNQRVKHREAFRPFAAACLADKVGSWFAPAVDNPYMLFAVSVLEAQRDRVPGVVHVDGTCRIQTVSASDNPLFFALLTAFERLTQIPILINTSFNVRGEPIVETPIDALDCLLTTGIDAIFCGPYRIERRPLDDVIYRRGRYRFAPGVELTVRPEVGSTVYRLRRPTAHPTTRDLTTAVERRLALEIAERGVTGAEVDWQALWDLLRDGWILVEPERPV